ncbi:MAG TPA: ComEC/Rec2 family competence protein [Tepidisphaeraceae bacterium]|nr:ComEC/Rec2 family competence protein [Tepidisphaeraceae bacterium]
MSLGALPEPAFSSRRPAVPVVLALIGGILCIHFLPAWPVVWLIMLAVFIGTAFALWKRPFFCSAALLGAIFVAGLLVVQVEAFYYPKNDIGLFATDDPRLAQLELHLDDPPRDIIGTFDQGRPFPPKQVVLASVRRVKTWNGWVDGAGQVLVQIGQPHPRLAQGQVIRVIAKLQRPAPAMNPGQFDWAAYYREQRILASVQVMQANNIAILSEGSIGPFTWLRQQARRLLARGFDLNDSLDHALLRALVLGDNDPELRDVQEQFRRTGTSHHLSISGMHVAIVGMVVFLLCRLLRFNPRTSCWIGLVCVLLYGIVALPSAPVVRSVTLCTCFAVGILLRRSPDLIQLLCLSAVGMLVYHPLDLFNAGFQLSFGVVLGLTLLTPPLLQMLPGRDLDEEIANMAKLHMPVDQTALTPWPGPYSHMQWKMRQRIRLIAAGSIIAWLVSMPLIAFHFEQLNPWAVPAGILLAPFVMAALIGGFAKIVLTLLWPGQSMIWAKAAAIPVAWMRHTVNWLGTFPGSEIPMPAPPVWMVLLFLALLVLIWAPWRGRVLAWLARTTSFAGCMALAIMPMRQGLASLHAQEGEMKLTLLAVGAGQCAVLEPPGAPAVIFDAGSSSISDVVFKALGPFLRHEGRRDIKSIFISHPDYDHFSAVDEIVKAYDVNAIFISPEFRPQSIESPAAEILLRELDGMERPPRQIEKGQNIDLGNGVALEVFWPPPGLNFPDHNDCSLVMRLTYAGHSVLFTGDIQATAERALMQSGQNLHADVLVAPHHGSNEPTTAAFVAAVNPSAIICSDDRSPSSKQLQFDRVMRDYRVLRTRKSGAITVRIGKEGDLKVEPFLHKQANN